MVFYVNVLLHSESGIISRSAYLRGPKGRYIKTGFLKGNRQVESLGQLNVVGSEKMRFGSRKGKVIFLAVQSVPES